VADQEFVDVAARDPRRVDLQVAVSSFGDRDALGAPNVPTGCFLKDRLAALGAAIPAGRRRPQARTVSLGWR
jgi:hypothetical protein